MNHTVLGIIYLIGFSHALLLSIALWTRASAGSPAKLLATVTALISYKLFESGVLYSGLYGYLVHVMDLLPGEVLFIGPLYYLYTRSMRAQAKLRWYQIAIHLFPALCLWGFNLPAILQSTDGKIAMWQSVLSSQQNGPLPLIWIVILLAIKLHLATYLTLSWRNVSKYKNVVEDLRSDQSYAILSGMRNTLIALFCLEALWVGLFIAQQFFAIGTLNLVSQIWLLFVSALVLLTGYLGLKQPNLVFSQEEQVLANQLQQPKLFADSQNVIEQPSNESAEQDSALPTNIKYFHSALPTSTGNLIAESLEQQFKTHRWYLNEKLTLTELAKLTGIKSHTLSQVINQTMNTNFYKLVNSYRIEHAVNLIHQAALNWPLERIAYESGFANRVTFSNAFKQIMHCTPSAYKKHQQGDDTTKLG